jgi:ribosomal protein S18 acetylase RimI-like enzyme
MSIEANERAAAAARLPGESVIDGAFEQFGYRARAEQAYLRVVEDNDAAMGLYRSMGYEVSLRYRYRRAGVEGR